MDFPYSVIAMMSPEDSWVAKWQRIGNIHTPLLIHSESILIVSAACLMMTVFVNL